MKVRLLKPLQGNEYIIENSHCCNIAILFPMSFPIELIVFFFCSSHVPFHHYCHAFNSLWCVTTDIYFVTFIYVCICLFHLGVFKPRPHWPGWLLPFAWWFPHLGPRRLHPHAPTSRCAGCGSNPWCCEGQLGRQLCPEEPKNVRGAALHCAVEDQLFCKCKIQGEILIDCMKF